MRITVANEDRSGTLGRQIEEAAEAVRIGAGPSFLPIEYSALSLKTVRNETEYRHTLIKLLRNRSGLDTEDFDIPRKPGTAGKLFAALKRILWKLLRYQHDRMAFKQNVINDLVIGHMEFEMMTRDEQMRSLQNRISHLESALKDDTLTGSPE